MSKKNGKSQGKREEALSDGAPDPAPPSVMFPGSFADKGSKVERLITAYLAEVGRSGLHKAVFIGTAKSKRQGQPTVAPLCDSNFPPQAICGLAICPEGQAVLKFAIYATAK